MFTYKSVFVNVRTRTLCLFVVSSSSLSMKNPFYPLLAFLPHSLFCSLCAFFFRFRSFFSPLRLGVRDWITLGLYCMYVLLPSQLQWTRFLALILLTTQQTHLHTQPQTHAHTHTEPTGYEHA